MVSQAIVLLSSKMKKNYLLIENNIVSNIIVWDGDTKVWSPPINAIAIEQEITPAIIWQEIIENEKIVDYIQKELIGAGQIGFTWNGSELITNQQKPEIKE